MLWQLPKFEPTEGNEVDPKLTRPSEFPFLGTPLRKVLSKSLLSDMAASTNVSPFPLTPTLTRGRSPTRPLRASYMKSPSSSPPKKRATLLRESQEESSMEISLSPPTLNSVDELSHGQIIRDQPAEIKDRTESLIQALRLFREHIYDIKEGLNENDLKRLRRELGFTLNAVDHKPWMWSERQSEVSCSTIGAPQ